MAGPVLRAWIAALPMRLELGLPVFESLSSLPPRAQRLCLSILAVPLSLFVGSLCPRLHSCSGAPCSPCLSRVATTGGQSGLSVWRLPLKAL